MQVSLMLQVLHDEGVSQKERKLTKKQLKLGGFISFEQNVTFKNCQGCVASSVSRAWHLEIRRQMERTWELLGASLVAQMVKRLPLMQETQVQSLGWEDLLEKEMPSHSSILAWKIPWMEEPGRLQSTGSQRVGHDWATSHTQGQRTAGRQIYGKPMVAN